MNGNLILSRTTGAIGAIIAFVSTMGPLYCSSILTGRLPPGKEGKSIAKSPAKSPAKRAKTVVVAQAGRTGKRKLQLNLLPTMPLDILFEVCGLHFY
jgi:hypothetical protein